MGRFGRSCAPVQSYQPQECQSNSGTTCDNNGCYSNSDMQQYNNISKQQGGCGAVGDLQIIRPEGNAFATPDQYAAAVKSAAQFTDQNYDQALKDAAAKGQPVVAIFGSKDTPDTQKLLSQAMAAQKAGAEGATYVYIDTDRVAQSPNSNLAKFVDQNIRKENLAHTMVFTQSPDGAGNPVPDAPMMRTWGGRDEIASLIAQHVKYGQDAMKGRQFNVKENGDGTAPKADANDKVKPEKPATVAKTNEELLRDVKAGIEEGKNTTDWREGEKQFMKAVRAADQIDQQKLSGDMKQLEEAKKSAVAKSDLNEALKIDKQMEQLREMKDAAWQARMEFGFQCMKWNSNYKDIGEKWLMTAGDRNSDMYMNPQFRARMKDAGYTPQTENAFAKRVAQHDLNKIGPAGPEQRDVGPNSTPADSQIPPNSTKSDRQFPRSVVNPDISERPRVTPQTQPQKQETDFRPKVKPEERREVKPSDRPEKLAEKLTVNGLYDKKTNLPLDSKDDLNEAEVSVLEKAAKDKTELSTMFGATWCKLCPKILERFEGNATDRNKTYYSNHDMDRSGLASMVGNDFGHAPNAYSFRVEKVGERNYRLTNTSTHQQFNVSYPKKR